MKKIFAIMLALCVVLSLASCGGNVISVNHERGSEVSDINGCYLRLVLETRNFEHIKEINAALTNAGFKLIEG